MGFVEANTRSLLPEPKNSGEDMHERSAFGQYLHELKVAATIAIPTGAALAAAWALTHPGVAEALLNSIK